MRLSLIFLHTRYQNLFNKDIKPFTTKIRNNTFLYNENINIDNIPNKKGFINVKDENTLEATKRYINKKITVLNFANPTTPGGCIYDGSKNQEESLCRSTNLYESINQRFLYLNYYNKNKKNDGYYKNELIYTKDVLVYKTSDLYCKMLDENNKYLIDVISCSAPCIYKIKKKELDLEKLKNILIERIEYILKTAILHNTEILILGAFGCGAFRNPPEIVAEAFKYVLIDKGYNKHFEEIIFAIPNKNNNYKIFKEFLKTNQEVIKNEF